MKNDKKRIAFCISVTVVVSDPELLYPHGITSRYTRPPATPHDWSSYECLIIPLVNANKDEIDARRQSTCLPASRMPSMKRFDTEETIQYPAASMDDEAGRHLRLFIVSILLALSSVDDVLVVYSSNNLPSSPPSSFPPYPSRRVYTPIISLPSFSVLRPARLPPSLTTAQRKERKRKRDKPTHQFKVSGLIVLNLFLCFHQVLHEAFSNLTPFAISFLCLVMDLHDAQTSSSAQS